MGTALLRLPDRRPYSTIDPFRRPNWRFDRVIAMCDRVPTPGRCTPRDDEYVRRARHFLLRHRAFDDNRREELRWEDGDLFAAYEVYRAKVNREGDQAFTLESRILSGQDDDEIAKHYSFGPRAVDYYEALFFNVRDRLDRRDWITTQILIPALKRDTGATDTAAAGTWQPQDNAVIKTSLDGSLKFFAFFAGPWVLEQLLAGFEHNCRAASADEAPGFFEKHYIRAVKRRTAQSVNFFEINKFNVIDVFMTCNQIIATERAADTAEESRTKYDNHVKATLDGLPWTVGTREADNVPKSVAAFDDTTTELRDDELLMVAAGDEPGSLKGLEFVKIPAGKPKDEILGPKAKKKDE